MSGEVLEGGCLCGRVRYRAIAARAKALVCHCRDCQKQSGSAFSVLLAMPAADLAVEGELQTYETSAASGRSVQRRFCPHCGSPVLTVAPAMPERVAIKAGTLDAPGSLAPKLHLWCEQAWWPLPEGALHLPQQ